MLWKGRTVDSGCSPLTRRIHLFTRVSDSPFTPGPPLRLPCPEIVRFRTSMSRFDPVLTLLNVSVILRLYAVFQCNISFGTVYVFCIVTFEMVRKKMKNMKRHIVEKNGFPKPLGMVIILAALVLSCFINLIVNQDNKEHKVFDQSASTRVVEVLNQRIDG